MTLRLHRLLLFAAAAWAPGCKHAAPPPALPQIIDVQVLDRTVSDERAPLDLAQLTARARQVIGRATGFGLPDAGASGCDGMGRCYRLRVELRTEGGEDKARGKGVLRALLTAQLTPTSSDLGGHTFEQTAVAEREYELAKRGDLAQAWRAHAERAVEDVVRGLGARAHLASVDARALMLAIDGSDEDLREEAIRIVGERRERAAVPSLMRLLKTDDHELRDAVIGALGAIGDPRAVKPLTEVARFRDLVDLPKILDALALIGGAEARGYLEFVASGHESAEMRELAKESLARLERRLTRDLGAL